MFAPKTIIAVLAVMAGLASAAPTATHKTTFALGNGNPASGEGGCVLEVASEVGIGCVSIVVLDGTTNCDKLSTEKSGPACNGTATVDFSASPAKATFVEGDFTASCTLNGTTCSTSS
ncbi:hypothetical protein BGW36DRAFT_363743 [Talaromyces proteolyticus]|uniref:Uncharacterized protein n=1 Tax=Talaromyces proteolyticus TaxID=1131652 RepID=A0AAD4KKM7_9EURO|nr:uncharacterized protein BGW36DRAFT_363743 [Talaromyces proteolyticus]KAH8691411.1 hypothetical protein BGW36DRAFT_363743 [Talaromyces proteolyticus]